MFSHKMFDIYIFFSHTKVDIFYQVITCKNIMEIVLVFLPELKSCNQIKKNIPLLEKLTRIGHLEKVSQDLLYFIICHHMQEDFF
jgi:hypothetical protein